MKKKFRVCWGEMFKQSQNYYNTWQTYISLLLWPVFNSFATYYLYQTFDLSTLNKYGIDSLNSLLVFIFIGTMGYNCFWSMVQSALFMQDERKNGTIEIVFLTPANRLAVVYGRALGGILQNVWMFVFFIMVIIFFYRGFNAFSIVLIPIAFLILLVSSVVWGGLINSIFLISRDTDFWFGICDSPMELLSGVKLPVAAFPLVFRVLSYIFPLTYCLAIIRNIFISNKIEMLSIIMLVIVLGGLVFITILILKFAEKNNRKTGNLQLY